MLKTPQDFSQNYFFIIKVSNDNLNKLSQNNKGFIETAGIVIELLPATSFKVRLENGHEILAYLSGKMRMYKIKILPGDNVKIEMSPYDLNKGRIVYRFKKNESQSFN